MNEFLMFVDDLRCRFPIHVEIYYSKIMDWCIKITKKGCAKDYPNSMYDGSDAILVTESGCDMQLVFAKAYVALKEWLSANVGGY